MPTRTTIFATNDNVSANDLNALAGAWNSYTPTLAQGTATNISKTVNYAKYVQFGKLVMVRLNLGVTGTGAAGVVSVTLPVTAAYSGLYVGQGVFFDQSSGIFYPVFANLGSTTTVDLARASGSGGRVGDDPSVVVGAGDVFSCQFMFEAA